MAGDPNNREGLTLKRLALYRHGKSLFDQTNYDALYKTLTTLPTEAVRRFTSWRPDPELG